MIGKHHLAQRWIAIAFAIACIGAAAPAPNAVIALKAPSTDVETVAVVATALDQPCEPGEDLRTSELCAQWKAADATAAAADWTARTFWLAVFGTALGTGTLMAAFFAARYAKRAASEARRAADIARDALIASERAWLTVELHPDSDLSFDRTGGCGLSVYLTIKNIGRTPALNVQTNMEMVAMRQNHVEEVAAHALRQRGPNRDWSRTLLPGDSYDRKWGLSLDDYKTSPYATIFGSVTYETLPDRALHQTTFCYIVGRGEIGMLTGEDIPIEEVHFTVTSGGFAD